MRIAVIGGGVSGLTCGVGLLGEGASVALVAREPFAATTSAVAGAVWFPYRVRPNERTGPWGAAGYSRFSRLAADERMPVSMVETTILYGPALSEEPWWTASVPGDAVRVPAAAELPEGYADGRAVRVPCIEAPAYLEWLARRFSELGGRTEVRSVGSLDELEGSVVVNCAGAGAGALVGDEAARP